MGVRVDERQNIEAFSDVAREFCNWCESVDGEKATETQAASLLCRLYAAALALPIVDCENSDGLPDLPPQLLDRAKQNLNIYNGRYYREFFDPDPMLSDSWCMGDIGDDLLDTYKNVRAGLLLFERGQQIDAAWQWRFLHRVHWGRHAAGAIFALHCLVISKDEFYGG
jgi:hypothetical protein